MLPVCHEELHALGKRFVSSHHKGMKRLAQFWELDAEETRKACSWCPTAVMAHMPRLPALIQMLENASVARAAWVAQVGVINWAAKDEHPKLDGNVELLMRALLRRLYPLLRSELKLLLPWMGGRGQGRLVWACAATLLQKGREVVTGAAAVGTGRNECDVLCTLPSDADLGMRPTVASAINTVSPTVARQLAENVSLFNDMRRAHASSGPRVRAADDFVLASDRGEDGACASAVLAPDCPNSDEASSSMSCAAPESPGMITLMLRMLIFVASAATHHTHSVCKPATIAARASSALNITVPPELLNGAPLQKEQCFPTLHTGSVGGDGRASQRLALRTASDLRVDTQRLFRSRIGGSDLVFRLNPSALNLASLALQPRASSKRGLEQAALVGQVISLASGTCAGRNISNARLLTDEQLERSEALIHASNQAFLGTLPKRRRYE